MTTSSIGRITGARISVFEKTGAGIDCTGSAQDVLEHELGHVFGLTDAGAGCAGTIMGSVTGAIDTGACEAADSNYLTTEESNKSTGDDGGPCGN